MAERRKRQPLTEETKAKIRAKLKDRVVSQETRDKLAKASTGRRKSDAEKRAIQRGVLAYYAARRAREQEHGGAG